MTVFKHPTPSFETKKAELTRREDSYFKDYVCCSLAIDRRWIDALSANSHRVLRFILGRTLSFKKKAEVIPKRHFLSGIEGVCCPVGISETTLDAALKDLEASGFIHIHSFFQKNVEFLYRIYEPNIGKILSDNAYLTDSEWTDMAENQQKTTKIPGMNTPRKFRGGPPLKSGGLNIVSRSKGDTIVSPSTQAPKLNEPRRARAKSQNEVDFKSGRDLVSSLQEKQRARRQERTATANDPAGRQWTKQSLQALFDTAVAQAKEEGYAVTRLVATDKGRRLLQERMVAREITDATAFFGWAIKNWSQVAAAHANSTRKQRSEGKDIARSMHRAPNFDDLYQRLPYIAQFYQNAQFHNEEKEIERKDKEEKAAANTRARGEASEIRRRQVRSRDIQREAELKQQEDRLQSTIRRNRSKPIDTEEDDEFTDIPATYEEYVARRRNVK